jgi:hypothetical protein
MMANKRTERSKHFPHRATISVTERQTETTTSNRYSREYQRRR